MVLLDDSVQHLLAQCCTVVQSTLAEQEGRLIATSIFHQSIHFYFKSNESLKECKDDESLTCDAKPQPFTKEMFIEEMQKWKWEKQMKFEKFFNESGYYQIFIKPSSREVESFNKEDKVFLLSLAGSEELFTAQ